MSALDLLIRRLMSQRASVERAASLVTQLPGPALLIGWGDGTVYDHLHEIMRRRDLFVFDRRIDGAADGAPVAEHRILGDPAETLPQAWERWRREAAFACLNFPAPAHHAAELAPLLAPLMRPGAVIIAEAVLELPGLEAIAPPPGVRDAREYLYRVS